MGCVASRIQKEERVQICKERKRLMKQLVVLRGDFAEAYVAYLRALKNTGVTLRQFTESESLELDNASYVQALPTSPPLPLPPSPPPPPSFSPDLRKSTDNRKEELDGEGRMNVNDDELSCPPSPPIVSSSWNIWDPFELPWLQHEEEKRKMVEPTVEEENWAETKTEFEDDDHGDVNAGNVVSTSFPQQLLSPLKLVDDDSSMASWSTKDTADGMLANRRSKKSLEGIIKELDDYFLKASAGGKETAFLMDISEGDMFRRQNSKEGKINSAKVFSALSWSWSSKSLQHTKDVNEALGASEPCKPGAHRITLDKLYATEQKLYKEMKAEELAKIEQEKKSALLLKQEEENHDLSKMEKTQFSIEDLEIDIRSLQHSISRTSSSILEVIDLELYPQLVALTTGLKSTWRTMHECHQIQNHIAQQFNYLTDNQSADVTTKDRHQATAQLVTEVTSWHSSFCRLMKSQQEYVRTLCRWIQLTSCLVGDDRCGSCSSTVSCLCEEWLLIFDRLPDKIASDAIKTLLSAIEEIISQQDKEYNLHRKSDKLEKRLEKELISLSEMEKKVDRSFAARDVQSSLCPKHPLSIKRSKTEALKKRVDTEKSKYLNSVQVTRVITLNNLKTSLPSVFQALMGFSSASAQAFEVVQSHSRSRADSGASEGLTS